MRCVGIIKWCIGMRTCADVLQMTTILPPPSRRQSCPRRSMFEVHPTGLSDFLLFLVFNYTPKDFNTVNFILTIMDVVNSVGNTLGLAFLGTRKRRNIINKIYFFIHNSCWFFCAFIYNYLKSVKEQQPYICWRSIGSTE